MVKISGDLLTRRKDFPLCSEFPLHAHSLRRMGVHVKYDDPFPPEMVTVRGDAAITEGFRVEELL